MRAIDKRRLGLLDAVSLVSCCGFCLVIGALIFSRGYLLNRKVIDEKSTKVQIQSHQVNQDNQGFHNRHNVSSNTNRFSSSTSNRSSGSGSGKIFNKMIFVVVDALRYDFIHRLKFLSNQCSDNGNDNDNESTPINRKRRRRTCCTFRCISDPPTTTMQRLKALTTGTMPTFVDVSANFNSYEIEEDSLIYQFDHEGYKIGFLGDDTWLSLFPSKYFKGIVEGHPSFNAWDLDTVDYAINATLPSLFKTPNPNTENNYTDRDTEDGEDRNNSWDILIIHYLGIDHCGHRYGPNHIEMTRKLDEIDSALHFIYNSMSTDTLLVIVGDHGMTETGDHGGDSIDEIQSGLIFLTNSNDKNEDKSIICNSELNNPITVSQIDLVPTLAVLFELPIPFSSLGEVIPTIIMDDNFYLEALLQNILQVERYIHTYGFSNSQSEILQHLYTNATSVYTQINANNNNNSATKQLFKRLAKSYLSQVKQIATTTWTQFDLVNMTCGILICILSLLSLIITTTLQEFRQKQDQHGRFNNININIVNLLPLMAIIVSSAIYFISYDTLIVFGIISFSLIVVIFKNVLWFIKHQHKDKSKYRITKIQNEIKTNTVTTVPVLSVILPILLYGFACFGVLSNSFVINEGTILRTILSFLLLINCLLRKPAVTISNQSKEETDRKRVISNKSLYLWLPFLAVLFILRISQIFFRCREELTNCTEEYLLHKSLSSLPNEWIVHKYIRYSIALISLAILVVSLRSFMLGRKCILSSRPCSVIGKYIPSVLVVLLCVHWALQGLLFGQLVQIQIRPLIQYFPFVFQVLAIGSLGVIWIKPLCCIGININNQTNDYLGKSQVDNVNVREREGEAEEIPSANSATATNSATQHNVQKQSTIESLSLIDKEWGKELAMDERSNFIHGSSLLTYSIIVTLLLTHITSIGLTPILTCIPYTIAGLVVMFEPSIKVDSWSAAISWTLASQFFFYATGHQPIFSSIPWDSAFTTDTNNMTTDGFIFWINWIQPAASVLCNLYSSQILFSLTLPLLVFWKSTNPTHLQLNQMLNLCAKFISLYGLKLLTCMLCVTIHRRHLMVWKIFTPKLIFEGIAFIVLYFTISLSILFILRVQFLFQKISAKSTLAIGH